MEAFTEMQNWTQQDAGFGLWVLNLLLYCYILIFTEVQLCGCYYLKSLHTWWSENDELQILKNGMCGIDRKYETSIIKTNINLI